MPRMSLPRVKMPSLPKMPFMPSMARLPFRGNTKAPAPAAKPQPLSAAPGLGIVTNGRPMPPGLPQACVWRSTGGASGFGRGACNGERLPQLFL